MTERPSFFDMAGVAVLLGVIIGSGLGGAVGLAIDPDWLVPMTALGIAIGLTIGVLGERRAADRRRKAQAKEIDQ